MSTDRLNTLTANLAKFNQGRLEPGSVSDRHPSDILYIEMLRDIVRKDIPIGADFEWYESLLTHGPGQSDPLFDWIAESATREQMVWFLSQEAAGEAGFDDLVAMTQVKMPVRAKLEMARNYWDEMGRGEQKGMHGGLLQGVLDYFGIVPDYRTTCLEALLLSNLMVGLASYRRYAYLSVGALGVIEMTAPGRVARVDQGLARLGVPPDARLYFSLHAALDVKHSREWNREVIQPLPPQRVQEVAEGAYLRLWAGKRCFDRYRQELLAPAFEI